MLDRMLLEQMLGSLNTEERELIYLRFFKERTQSNIAKKMGMSQVQISRMEKRILKKLTTAKTSPIAVNGLRGQRRMMKCASTPTSEQSMNMVFGKTNSMMVIASLPMACVWFDIALSPVRNMK